MKISQARKTLAEWKNRLGLTEWTISLRWGTVHEVEGVDGTCIWKPEYGICEISLNRLQSDSEVPRTIAHELVHLCLQGHKEHNGHYDALFEKGINRIVDALFAQR